jgi:hypothetical protein
MSQTVFCNFQQKNTSKEIALEKCINMVACGQQLDTTPELVGQV